MASTMFRNAFELALVAALAAGLGGCRIHVDKDANGGDKNVRIDTPFGGLHVNTDQLTATDLGLPVYPGAQLRNTDDKHKSADVHMGFGEWQMRVRAVGYSSHDAQDKVLAFYKQALGRYGDVLTCDNNKPISQPTVTKEGLTCESDKNEKVHVDNGYDSSSGGLQLKAGSKRHQHILAFDSPGVNETRFALVALDLPNLGEDKKSKND